ncbi:hypothetical protein RvY_15557-2 [Ramazzottius varieornatus]|uniref:sn-1-specific diacylglycerol lipase ABHD11 n=1 Tax=Ramazzottius varieornatus TaxID=947166 RepID=A0A1D1W3A6_RAMVA|nr:hypothetical protein RvY_15557-2 [Ramazzottius varieornatus]
MLISLSDLLKSQSPHPDSRILSSFYPLHHRPALQRGFWTQYIVVDTSSGPQHLPYRRRRYVCSKSALAISCRQLAVRPEVRDSCSGMISSRNARQSARICNLASSLGSLPTSASCRPFTSSQRCCAIPLAYARYDPPRSEKPPVVEYPVIILHGLFGNKMNWQAIAKKLKDKLRQSIICVDARNHGESRHDPDNSYEAMSDDVEELVHRLKIPKAILVGHSMVGRESSHVYRATEACRSGFFDSS